VQEGVNLHRRPNDLKGTDVKPGGLLRPGASRRLIGQGGGAAQGVQGQSRPRREILDVEPVAHRLLPEGYLRRTPSGLLRVD